MFIAVGGNARVSVVTAPRRAPSPAPAAVRWRPIPGLEGLYEASSRGGIRNSRTGRILKPFAHPDGYVQFNAWLGDGRFERWYVHRAVAAAFLGEPPAGRPEVDHRDGRRDNNRIGNLRWVGRTENIRLAAAAGRLARGERNPASKLTPAAVREIRDRVLSGETMKAVARDHGVARSVVSRIMAGTAWKWVD